ncbi:PLP-dependent transferase [Wolfiporia cocos MD-104 SS10]|uniref:PLP-dependent transferase n=1 Tax=Wolfiporia cocos (strain MD-104) TaxID=742152 RepID=A0A2H3JK59_WOLCO|nr:PLP-dependent transferase [Wolfiporia cocos MD-104 SS10]
MATITASQAPPDKQSYDTYDINVKPPPFGHAIKPYWAFDPAYINLNHGSYGSAPLPVLFKCAELSTLSERNPDLFHRISYIPLLKDARKRVADVIGADHDEVVLVPNATHAINTVLRNLEWREGDVLMGASTTYGAVLRSIQYVSDRSEPPRPVAHTVTYTFPMTYAEIVDTFRAHSVPSGTYTAKKNKFVAVIDSLVANPGVLLPWKQLVQVCKEEGVWSIIDGAHSIGQETNIRVGQAKPDFFVSNCHKWLYSKRGCALLYVPYRNQHLIKSSIPTSHGYALSSNIPSIEGNSFVQQHEWTGTVDLAPFLSVSAALDFRQWLGGEAIINDYCHQLAMKGGKRLAEVMQTNVLDDTGELTLNMTNVLLPLPVETNEGEIYTSATLNEINNTLRDKLLFDWNTYAAHYFHAGGWWCRCSAQVWNEISDFEYVGAAFNAICKEIKNTILTKKDKTGGAF